MAKHAVRLNTNTHLFGVGYALTMSVLLRADEYASTRVHAMQLHNTKVSAEPSLSLGISFLTVMHVKRVIRL